MKRGFSMIELLIAGLIMGLILLVVFGAFIYGTRSFRQAVLRSGLQGDSQKTTVKLGRDVRLSDFHSGFHVTRTLATSDGRLVNRDALAVAALSDWADGTKFDPVTALPMWDQHIVYYATNDGDKGRLIRQVIDPGGPTGGAKYFALNANINNDPALNSSVFSSEILSQDVDSFRAEVVDANEAIEVTLILRREQSQRAGNGEPIQESLESQYSLTARNTFPKL